ncbi:hypothetical protein C8R45DRAFT_1018014 [Mycena sanguinolenta]|nr:hypothetical protein C8R45DRAFT_1018014 [Mycena sanguinolenta]
MYSTLIALLFLVSSAAGQATTLPQCAQGCANEAAATVKCSLSDTACLCKTSFASSVLQCAGTTSCSADDQAQVSTILEGLCAAVSTSSSGSSSSVSASASSSLSLSRSLSLSVSGTSSAPSAPSSSLTIITITSTVTSVSPPRTTTIITSVPVSATLVPPPISPSLPLSVSLPSSVPSATTPATSSSAPSTSPSTAAAQDLRVRGASVAGALLGVVMWLL